MWIADECLRLSDEILHQTSVYCKHIQICISHSIIIHHYNGKEKCNVFFLNAIIIALYCYKPLQFVRSWIANKWLLQTVYDAIPEWSPTLYRLLIRSSKTASNNWRPIPEPRNWGRTKNWSINAIPSSCNAIDTDPTNSPLNNYI